ncbi:tRNA-specific 2-thiouridylase [Alistipes sp. OttesenSCG-928-B03]|nr:tRNA-specific 2-thiouridylase [Alistipes sp. OttesenSCG-928-B03]
MAFSGGIDSSHAARVLADGGYRVTALYLDMYGDAQQLDAAREKAAQIGVDFLSVDVQARFAERVVDYFTGEYLRGRTPAPCTVCNREIKWRSLCEAARAGGYDHIATGHYLNIAMHGGRYYVTRAADPIKDQSYYLWALPQEALAMAVAPMGGVLKSDVKRAAGVGDGGESMGVCFLRGQGCGEFLRARCADAVRPGEVADRDGRIIGRHDGTPLYTIGQKRGLDIPVGMCVTGIDAARNRLVAGTDKELYHSHLVISGCNIVDMDEALTARDISVMIRGYGRNPQGACRIEPHPSGLHIALCDPAWAPAAGQPVVLYRGDRVIGGGWLEEYF